MRDQEQIIHRQSYTNQSIQQIPQFPWKWLLISRLKVKLCTHLLFALFTMASLAPCTRRPVQRSRRETRLPTRAAVGSRCPWPQTILQSPSTPARCPTPPPLPSARLYGRRRAQRAPPAPP